MRGLLTGEQVKGIRELRQQQAQRAQTEQAAQVRQHTSVTKHGVGASKDSPCSQQFICLELRCSNCGCEFNIADANAPVYGMVLSGPSRAGSVWGAGVDRVVCTYSYANLGRGVYIDCPECKGQVVVRHEPITDNREEGGS